MYYLPQIIVNVNSIELIRAELLNYTHCLQESVFKSGTIYVWSISSKQNNNSNNTTTKRKTQRMEEKSGLNFKYTQLNKPKQKQLSWIKVKRYVQRTSVEFPIEDIKHHRSNLSIYLMIFFTNFFFFKEQWCRIKEEILQAKGRKWCGNIDLVFCK